MGHKVHPIGFRLGIVHDWQAKWYADKGYKDLLQEDLRLRTSIETRYRDAGIARVDIERQANQVTVTLHSSRPGIVIGRGGQRVDETRVLLEELTGKKVRLNIQEIRQPELDARLVSRSVADQIERRIAFRRAMKQSIARTMQSGAKGIKIICSGRLAGAEIARQATMRQGRVPLHTLRADIDFGISEAHTTLGLIGVKVWIYKGEVLSGRKVVEAAEAAAVTAAPTPLSEAIGEVESATTKESKVPQDS